MRRKETTRGQVGSKATQELALLDWTESKIMVQRVKENTRQNQLLNLVFVNNTEIYRNVSVEVNMSYSDHNTVLVQVEAVEVDEETDKDYIYLTTIRNYKYESLEEESWTKSEDFRPADWEPFHSGGPSQKQEVLFGNAIKAVEKTAPLKKRRQGNS